VSTNTEIAWSFWENVNRGRVEDALNILNDSGTWWSLRSGTTIPMSEMKGLIPKSFPPQRVILTLLDAIETGDRVVLEVKREVSSEDGVKNSTNQYCFVLTMLGETILHSKARVHRQR
jgi:ketosteroid isomerase-like protein